tara:strand:- start:831 stop:1277 length:447 start_codon:yes stop_codon:yes gene_type:complete
MSKIFKNFNEVVLDFNDLFKLLSKGDYVTKVYQRQNNAFYNHFKIENVHKDKFFWGLINAMCNGINVKNANLDAHIFTSFLSGIGGVAHTDNYEHVLLYNLYGETIYIVEDTKYIVTPKDLLHIEGGEIHQAISLTPRITLSLAIKGN